MKNSVDAAAFYKAMTALLDIPAKSSIRALREIKVTFDANQCVLSATDLNTWMSVTLPASGDSFDFVFRNSASIQKVCRHFDGTLELELQQRGDESFLSMRSGSKGGEFPVYDTKDCPVWPEIGRARGKTRVRRTERPPFPPVLPEREPPPARILAHKNQSDASSAIPPKFVSLSVG